MKQELTFLIRTFLLPKEKSQLLGVEFYFKLAVLYMDASTLAF